jgi:dipeptidyl aminopeptidase/acylaminoacyl peptidase
VNADGTSTDLLPPPWSARSRVHEYGGRSHLALPGALLFVSQADQQLWIKPQDGEPRALTSAPELRFAEPIADPSRGRIIAVAEHHRDGAVENTLVAIALDGGAVQVLASGRDFYAAPALSPDGRELAFIAWDHPHMPWDAAQLCVLPLAPAAPVRVLAGDASRSAFQPIWSARGDLYFALERDGYWNLHRRLGQEIEWVAPLEAELGAPLWQLGTRLFGFAPDGSVVGACVERGLTRIVRIDVEHGQIETLSRELPQVTQLELDGGGSAVALVGSSRLVPIDLRTGAQTTLRDVYAGWLERGDTSEPESISFPTSVDETAHGFFYPPQNQRHAAPSGTLPPLIVIVHGGPTANTAPVFSPSIQYWTTRGFAVLDVNYRGSTGYGRAYRDRLRGEWGVLDVEDCVAGARFLAESGRVDGGQLLIRGGSAGGFTVLRALADHDLFAAGSCHYGVSDLETLARDTHKFESHYPTFLIGPYPEARDKFIERSAIHEVGKIKRPVIFFQGLDDRVVPPDQTERMALTLREHGITTEYHAYPGEQHGFRQAATIRHVLETELAFFQRIIGA